MGIVEQADLILALGTRRGPFDTLRRYSFAHRPRDAGIIQVSLELGEPFRWDAVRVPVRLLPKYAGYSNRQARDRRSPTLSG